jgi:hypothetical protein
MPVIHDAFATRRRLKGFENVWYGSWEMIKVS